MESKYIKGTNKQYSIREDGVVISHYRYNWKGNVQKNNKDRVLKIYPNKTVTMSLKPKNITITINALLKEYFNTSRCSACNKLFTVINNSYKCDSCKTISLQQGNKKRRIKHRKEISKSIVASHLRLSVKELSEDLYQNHRNLIILKRKIAKELNTNIQSLNNY